MQEYYHTLMEKDAIHVGIGKTVMESDYQILGHKNNEAITPPEKKWIGVTLLPFPHPTFLRLKD
jgi:hypothetical protein